MANVQVAIRLRRETRNHFGHTATVQIVLNDLGDKVVALAGSFFHFIHWGVVISHNRPFFVQTPQATHNSLA